MNDIVCSIISSKNKKLVYFPFSENNCEIEDFIRFGFSFIEQEDHLLEYIIASPVTIRKLIRQIEDFNFCIDQSFLGTLWTAKIIMTDKIKDSQILFSNKDFSVILNLHTNNI